MTGILTGVYDAWASRLGHENVKLISGEGENLELFCEYVPVEPDLEKAGKVLRTVYNRMGWEAYWMLAQASVCPHEGKADSMYRVIVLGLHLPRGKRVMGMLTNPDVHLIFELSRKAGRLADHYKGFVRFEELENGVLFSEIQPEVDILLLIAPHFADRFSMEDWILYDRIRQKAAIHRRGKEWYFLEEVQEEDLSGLIRSRAEEQYQALWRSFHRAVGIEARANQTLQRNMLPLKFRDFMTEFKNINFVKKD